MRYAIYAVPEAGSPLAVAAETWLGRNVDPAAAPPQPVVPGGWTRDQVDAITQDARRYGFHATIKAPFRLVGDGSEAELADRLAAFVAWRSPVVVPELTLACLDGFFALVAGGESKPLQGLADDVVREFDDLRAPATDAEIARRRPERLDDRERELLYAYGYPYVLDRFLFHLTLTDRLPPSQQDAVEPVLRHHFDAALGRDLVLGSLALFVEPAPGQPFSLVSSYPFKGAAA